MAHYILRSYKLGIDPAGIFEIAGKQDKCIFLDSSLNADPCLGRYSVLAFDPFFTLKSKDKDPFGELRENLARYRFSSPAGRLPFLAGAAGYLSYDLGLKLEKKIRLRKKEETGIPGCVFGFYNSSVIIDHLKGQVHIFSIGFPEKSPSLAQSLARRNFKKIFRLLSHPDVTRRRSTVPLAARQRQANSNFTMEEYLRAVKKAKEYIRRGDIYQVNLSQRFDTTTQLSGYQIYSRLRQVSPSYFSAYFDAGDFQILSSSPERFLNLKGRRVITRPMKGTRPRSADETIDRRLKKELLESAKDKAELIMIVDLERNDLGKVCSYGSIKVDTLRQIEEYSTVFQTTANICGKLHEDKDGVDLLRACFPGGSVTGCPKIRSMEVIEELEPDRRSVYTGSLGYLGFSGDADFNILIRTILKKRDKIYFGVGGGIVADSKPEEEYRETLIKAKGIMKATGIS